MRYDRGYRTVCERRVLPPSNENTHVRRTESRYSKHQSILKKGTRQKFKEGNSILLMIALTGSQCKRTQ